MRTVTRRRTLGGPWKEDPVTGVLTPPPLIQDFLAWLTDPARMHLSISRWADENGVHLPTVKSWFRDPRFNAAFNEAADALNLRPDRTQAVVESLWKRAVNGDVKAAEVYLKYVGKFVPVPKQVEVKVRQVKDLSEAELMAELERVRKALPSGEVIDAEVVP